MCYFGHCPMSSTVRTCGSNMTWIFFRGADVNKNANSDDIEMKANLVNNKGDPNYGEETGPWNLHSLFVYEIHSATVFKDFKP